MSQNIRVSKLMRFAIDVAKNQAKSNGFYSISQKDPDYLNFIVGEWLRQNYTESELFDMGLYDLID